MALAKTYDQKAIHFLRDHSDIDAGGKGIAPKDLPVETERLKDIPLCFERPEEAPRR